MRFCAVWHDTVWHAASAAWQFGPSLVDFLVQGSTLVFNTKALLPASGLCLPIQWSCTGKLQDFQETLLFDTTALIKILSFFPTTALIWSTALIRYPRVMAWCGEGAKPLPEPMFAKIYDASWCMASLCQSEIKHGSRSLDSFIFMSCSNDELCIEFFHGGVAVILVLIHGYKCERGHCVARISNYNTKWYHPWLWLYRYIMPHKRWSI